MFAQLKYAKNRGRKAIIHYFKSFLPLGLTTNLTFFKNYKRFLNAKVPTLIDEKLLLLYAKDYSKNPLVTKCVDKYLVRDIVATKIGGGLLTPLIGAYDNSSEIDWNNLPDKFVAKCNHGCGYNIIVQDKDAADKDEICRKLDYWMEENFGRLSAELTYKNVPPKIIIEEFLDMGDGTLPPDYKFWCANGQVLFCFIVTEREKGAKYVCVDKDFKDLGYICGEHRLETPFAHLKPSNYQELWETAEKLSEDFPIVRVDLYSIKGKTYFGELTFTPHGCINPFFSEEIQKKIGDMVKY